MELEKYCIADVLFKKLDRYKMSVEMIDASLKLKGSIHHKITAYVGYGSESIDIPDEIVEEVFGVLKKHLESKIKELEEEFKRL